VLLYWLIYIVGFAVQSEDKERQWMSRLQNGDKEALRLLYRKYERILFGLIISILKNREEAEDCLQEVFTQLWEKADQFDASRGSVYSFLVTMARNKAIDRTRSRAFKDSGKEDHTISDSTFTPTSDKENPHKDLEINERAKIVREALQKLNNKEQKVLQIAYFQGLSQSQISNKLDIPLGTVKYRMRQGMIKLRENLIPDELR
jgi:RNA polymerase sigma-70 factor (ECF subfamily)